MVALRAVSSVETLVMTMAGWSDETTAETWADEKVVPWADVMVAPSVATTVASSAGKTVVAMVETLVCSLVGSKAWMKVG